MLIFEYKLRANASQRAAIDEAIRTTQFVRNKAIRLWMDGQHIGKNDLQALCAQLAQEVPFAARQEFHGTAGGGRSGLVRHQPLL